MYSWFEQTIHWIFTSRGCTLFLIELTYLMTLWNWSGRNCPPKSSLKIESNWCNQLAHESSILQTKKWRDFVITEVGVYQIQFSCQIKHAECKNVCCRIITHHVKCLFSSLVCKIPIITFSKQVMQDHWCNHLFIVVRAHAKQ